MTDIRIEAWAQTREQCVEEAVAALVEGVVDPGFDTEEAVETWFPVPLATDAELLVMVLDEVIYRMTTTGQIPVRTWVSARADDGLDVIQQIVEPETLDAVSAPPDEVRLQDLTFAAGETGWRCAAILAV
ncbi:archease [Kribbella sp. NPDC026611]|uniref:archease n=1 Tax=Kribbella sp. NPDC026611 TaxID=3154911 RepID=UPI00340814B1